MKYLEFFSIEMEHPSFTDSHLPLIMDANDETHAWIKNNGLIVKGKQNGIKVMAPSDLDLNMSKGKALTFLIFPDTEIFGLCTDMSTLSKQEMFTFTNTQRKRGAVSPLARAAAELIGDRYRGFKPAAVVTLIVDKLKMKNAPIHYRARFAPKKCKWKYYFVVHPEVQELTIEDKQAQVVFVKRDLSKDTSDELAPALNRTYPDDMVFCFESKKLMITSVNGRKDLQLKLHDQVLIRHLPNPKLTSRGIHVMDLRGH